MSCICHSGDIFFDLGYAIKIQLESNVYNSFNLNRVTKDYSHSENIGYIEQLMIDLFKLNHQAYYTRYSKHIEDGDTSPVVAFKDLNVSRFSTLSPIQMLKDITNILYQVSDYMDAKNQAEPLFTNMEWADDVYKRAGLLKDALYEWYVNNSDDYDKAEWKS